MKTIEFVININFRCHSFCSFLRFLKPSKRLDSVNFFVTFNWLIVSDKLSEWRLKKFARNIIFIQNIVPCYRILYNCMKVYIPSVCSKYVRIESKNCSVYNFRFKKYTRIHTKKMSRFVKC